jgi:hemerythrin-like domain-containing protein
MDPVNRLEHDHQHLNRIVESVRSAIAEALRGEREHADVMEDFEAFVRLVNEDLFEHFEREESVLFPWVLEVLPDTAERIASMESAHDRICGAASRIEYALTQGKDNPDQQFETLVAMFARFDANFVKHAQDERNFIDSMAARMTAEQRAVVAKMLDDI